MMYTPLPTPAKPHNEMVNSPSQSFLCCVPLHMAGVTHMLWRAVLCCDVLSAEHGRWAGLQQHALHSIKAQGQPAASLDLDGKWEAAGA